MLNKQIYLTFPFPRSDHISYTVHFVSNHVNTFPYFYIKLSFISWTVETFLFCVGSLYLQYAASGNGPHFIYIYIIYIYIFFYLPVISI